MQNPYWTLKFHSYVYFISNTEIPLLSDNPLQLINFSFQSLHSLCGTYYTSKKYNICLFFPKVRWTRGFFRKEV